MHYLNSIICPIYMCFMVYLFIHPYIHPLIQIWCGGVYFIVSCRHSTLPPKWFGPEIKEGELSLHVQMMFPNKEIVHTF